MAVNDVGMHMPEAPKHWCSLHSKFFPHWQFLRGFSTDFNLLHKFLAHGIESWPGDKRGTSGLFATRVAAALGYDEIVLAGVPLDDGGHYYDPPGHTPPMSHYSGQVEVWKEYVPVLRGKVKVVSGNLMKLFGGYNGNS